MLDFSLLGLNIQDVNPLSVSIRLLLAIVLGGLLGLERTRKQRPAGFRTYMLVCIGATVVTLTAQFMSQIDPNYDLGRMPAQVICGIGFLGAGTIMVTKHHRVRGLTTAAGLWACACMGIAIGIGFYLASVMTCIVLLVVMVLADKAEAAFTHKLRRLNLYIIFSSIEHTGTFAKQIRQEGMEINDIEITRGDGDCGAVLICLIHFPRGITAEQTMQKVIAMQGVLFVEQIDS